ncbi:MAG: ASPIC/UnbV domain-containing protein, partial [Anaerolineales bacterium]|nr:ASPIC/UnbV domain-containing protein [Anaerolineales bacterium]
EGGTGFAPMPRWNLGATASGRGMSMADLDGDGDLDIVVNNLRAPAQLFENQLCGGHSLQVDLFWPGSGNERAIGAALVLHSEEGSYYRDLKAASGYLSGDPARVHFGLPAGANLTLEIIWPDGLHSTITDLPIDSLVTVTRP